MTIGQISKMMGASVKRKEDPRLITGHGKYTDDVKLVGMLYLYVLRSPYAHAKINKIDVSKAKAVPGVRAVVTGAELKELVNRPMPVVAAFPGMNTSERWPLAIEKVNFAGEGVAAIVAISSAIARDAADLVDVDYEALPAVFDIEQAIESGSPVIFGEFGTNICYEAPGSSGDVEAAFQEADGTLEARFLQPRLVPNAMESRAVVADYDPSDDSLDLWVTTQSPHLQRFALSGILGIPESKLRVVAIDVGGGFGAKGNTYPEAVLAPLLSKMQGKPVKWTEERSENFVSTSHGRGQVQYVEAAYKNDGTLLGVKMRVIADLGAYPQFLSHMIPTLTPLLAPGVYKHQNLSWSTIGVYTNKTPTDAYRGAGRPEAAYLIERVMDLIGQKIGMDPIEIRRKNFIAKDAFPYVTPTGLQYDSGDYELALDRALEIAGYDDLKREQARLRVQGEYMGIGVSMTTEICGFGPAAILGGLGGYESATIRFHPTGSVTVLTGASSHGQGHETSFAQIVADDLGVPFDKINVVHGDTDIVPRGVGTFGSRSLVVGGTSLLYAGRIIKEKAKKIAAALLETDSDRVVLEGGVWMVEDIQGKAVGWDEVAAEAYDGQKLPPDVERGLEASYFWEPPNLTFPFAAHVCVVRVDKDTGVIKITKYVAVTDCGVVINPMIVDGQVHGGIAQGIGQALLEEAVYDEEGQLLSGSFLDYSMPKAETFPMFDLDNTVTPTPHNPMGAKGIGEMGTVSATPTVVTAVVDALSPLGVTHIDIPLKPEKIWQILNEK